MRNEIAIDKIIAYADKILAYSKGMDYEQLVGNTIVLEACIFNLSQIGELANKLDADFKEKHNHIPWKQIKGMRNKIVHEYEGVNFVLIWETIEDLPAFRESLMQIRRKNNN